MLEDIVKSFPARLVRLRKQKGLTQIRLSLASGVTEWWIGQIENKSKVNLSLETLMKLALGLEMSLDDMVGFDIGRALDHRKRDRNRREKQREIEETQAQVQTPTLIIGHWAGRRETDG